MLTLGIQDTVEGGLRRRAQEPEQPDRSICRIGKAVD